MIIPLSGKWVSAPVDEARTGVQQAPDDGIRPETAPRARWITWYPV